MVKSLSTILHETPALALDVTGETCPMTFVRTRLALDRLDPGAVLAVRLRGDEPYLGITTQARALGHAIIAEETGANGTTLLLVRKAMPERS